MKRKYIILLILLLAGLFANGQIRGFARQKIVDSLIALLPTTRGTVRVDLLNRLSIELAPRSFDSAIRYASDARRLAESINYTKGKGVAVFNAGNAWYFNLDIKNALENYLTALRILEPYEPSKEVAGVLYQLALLNQYVCNTDKVTLYFKRSMRNFLAIGDSLGYIDALQTLGTAYSFIWQTVIGSDSVAAENMIPLIDSAIRYHEIAISYSTFSHRRTSLIEITFETGLACLNYNLALYYSAKRDPLMEVYYLRAVDHAKLIEDPNIRNYMQGWIMSDLGADYYFQMNSSAKGYEYAFKGLQLLRLTGNNDALASALSNLGAMEVDKGRYQLAERYYLEGLRRADAFLGKQFSSVIFDETERIWGVTQVHWYKARILTHLVHLYELKQDYRKAVAFEKKLQEEKAVQSRDELTRQVTGLQANFDDEMKRNEIAGLQRDNELRRLQLNQTRVTFTGIGGTLLVTFLASVIWIQRKRFRTEQRSIVLEQKLLRSQMNPHFIFNSLTNIQNFILTERSEKASLYLTKFAALVRSILDNSVEEYVVLEKEIETLENYLELQKIRFAGKFDYRIRIADEIDTETLKIPPMLAQPFIENAIEHGIKHRETPGHLEIRFALKGNLLVFEVEDDGVGRVKAREIGIALDPQHKSMATSLTLERIANLNRKLKEKIRMEITDLQSAIGEATGTRVTFAIPVGA